MSINIGDNFSYLGKKFLDDREHFDTVAKMKACNDVPNGFMTYCDETNTRYEYHTDNEEDATLGKWRVFKSVPDVNFDEYVTQGELEEAIKDVDMTSQLENYATKEYVDEAIDGVDVTKQLQDYAKKSDIPNVPTKVSELENDSGYLTEHQSLEGLASETYVDNKVSNLVNSAPETLDTLNELAQALGDDPNFATTVSTQIGKKVDKVEGKSLVDDDEIERLANVNNYDDTEVRGLINAKANPSDIPTKVSQLENDSGYLTEHQDISGKVDKVDGKGLSTNDLTNELKTNYDSAYNHSISSHAPSNAQKNSDITKAEIEAKLTGNITSHTHDQYLTEHQDISHLAEKDYVDEAINGVDVTEQLREYAKLTDLNGLFDDVALNEAETTDSQTAIDFYSKGEVVKTVYFSGGSGTSATSAYISTELPENVLVSTGENFDLKLDFSSPNLGKGTLKVFINDVDAVSTSIGQGESITPISGDLFSKGQNKVVVYVLDRVGVMSNSLTFYVRYGSLEITSDFDAYSSYDYGSIVRYYFTPIAVDTSLALTMYMSIDGQTQTGVSCTSDTRGYFTFPSNLSVGNHLCKAWVQDSNGSLSNELVFNLIILNDTALVVATDTHDTVSIEEGEQLSLDYKVYMKGNSSFNVYVYVDNTQVSTGTCGLTTSYYKTSSLSLGLHTVKVEVFDLTNTVSDYVTWTVNITESSYEMKTPVTAGATFIASAKNKSNQDENREVWIGTDQDGNNIEVPLVNFSWNEESGWANDQLIISGNSYAEIPIKPLATNAKYGFTLDIEFLTRPIGVEDALVLDLWDEENNCGIKITTEELIMQSKAGNRCDLYFEEDTIVSAMFVIDRNEKTAKIYLDGVMCEAFHLTDYTANGVDYLEDFTVDKNIKLGGSGYCAIRNIRTYQVALTTNEIINNFISNKIVKSEQRELVEFQKGTDLPTMTIYCDFSGLGKDDKKPCNISYVSTDVNKYGESFTLDGKYSQLQYQGTSSMAYPIKNYRINPRDKNGKKKINPFIGGKPESRFTLKADFITSNHAHNTGMAKFISDKLYNYNDEDESTMNPMRWYLLQNGGDVNSVRETINGFPIRLILINDGSTTLNEGQAEPTPGNTKDMGIFNFNNDKDNLNTMGMDTDIFPNALSYEVTANSDTSAGAFVPYTPTIKVFNDGNYETQWFNTSEWGSLTVLLENKNSRLRWFNELGGTVYDQAGLKADGTTSVNPQDKSQYPYFNFLIHGVNSSSYEKITIGGVEYNIEFVDDRAELYSEVISKNSNKELEYLQNSFELRYPDEDDVGKDYGYLGISIQQLHLHVKGDSTYFIPVEHLESKTFSIDFERVENQYLHMFGKRADGTTFIEYTKTPNGTTTIADNVTHIRFYGLGSHNTYLKIGNITYLLERTENPIIEENPFSSYTLDSSYGLKRVIDWVGTCTDEEFVADFDKYFNRHYTLRYYLLVVLMAGVDNLG